jgi:pyruvate,orthophosphate dikinase
MARAAGVLTSRGGLASHAAVVARGWGIPAVVGAESVRIGDQVVAIGEHILKPGDTITIDGGSGDIFAGTVTGNTTIAPEAVTLLGWAKELGIDIGARASEATPAEGSGAVVAADIVQALLIKGSAYVDGLAAALLSGPDGVRAELDGLVAQGLVESVPDGFRLTKDGKAAGHAQLAADQKRWGTERAVAALDAFQALDHRTKEAVTAWQVREVDGAQVLNDHADPEYDKSVLSRLTSVQSVTAGWLSALGDAPSHLSRYVKRLELALTAARGGDHRYVASPRVDSYHGVCSSCWQAARVRRRAPPAALRLTRRQAWRSSCHRAPRRSWSGCAPSCGPARCRPGSGRRS